MTLTEENTRKRVKTKSYEINYNEAGSGHPIVLVHGGGPGASGWSNFNPNIPYLSERFRVLAIDLPGWGKSQPVTYKERNNSKALAEFLEALGIEKAAVVGNSMGGATCLKLAYERPDLVSHLVTMGPPSGVPGLFDAGGLSEGLKVMVAGYENPTEEAMRALTEIMTFDSSNVTDELIAERTRNALATRVHLTNWLAGRGHGPAVDIDQSRIKEITAPTLLLHGRDDRVLNFSISLWLCQMISNSRAHIVNRCGHWLQLEHAAEFNHLIEDFVKHH